MASFPEDLLHGHRQDRPLPRRRARKPHPRLETSTQRVRRRLPRPSPRHPQLATSHKVLDSLAGGDHRPSRCRRTPASPMVRAWLLRRGQLPPGRTIPVAHPGARSTTPSNEARSRWRRRSRRPAPGGRLAPQERPQPAAHQPRPRHDARPAGAPGTSSTATARCSGSTRPPSCSPTPSASPCIPMRSPAVLSLALGPPSLSPRWWMSARTGWSTMRVPDPIRFLDHGGTSGQGMTDG